MKYYRPFSIVLLVVLICINIKLYTPATPQIDKELLPYVDTFVTYCDYYQVDCSDVYNHSITLTDIPNRNALNKILGLSQEVAVGQCWHHSNEIQVSREYFDKSTVAEIDQLVIHELGHCVLGLDHIEEEKIVSIMNPYTLSEYNYLNGYNELYNAFFACSENCPQLQFNSDKY